MKNKKVGNGTRKKIAFAYKKFVFSLLGRIEREIYFGKIKK